MVAFKLKNPRKGTETRFFAGNPSPKQPFKLKNPRKGTETDIANLVEYRSLVFQIKESPEGDWNFL